MTIKKARLKVLEENKRALTYLEVYDLIKEKQYIDWSNDAALTDLNKAIQLDPAYAEAYFFKGMIKNEAGNYQEAILEFNKSIELNPVRLN